MENVYPDSKLVKSISTILSKPSFYKVLDPRVQPAEPYPHFKKADPGFVNPCRSLRAEDLTSKKRKKLRKLVKEKAGKKRFLTKITGWSMIQYLDNAFPKSKFIHILRDGRAVANSLMHVDFWEGWEGIHNWRWGYKDEYTEEIEKYDNSFAAVAALQWKLITKEINRSKEKISPDRFLEVKYEDLVKNPVGVVKESVEFTDETWSKSMDKIVGSYRTKNMNFKWKKNLSSKDKEILQDSLKETLIEYGYEI